MESSYCCMLRLRKLQLIQNVASSPSLDDVITTHCEYTCPVATATGGVHSCVPVAPVVVWSGTGILS